MSLTRYNEKRNFKKTTEPKGREHRRSDRGGTFVIQKHDASRLHYDFRLEMEGVLRSWAVPKGPSLDPADKRLAVQVEDHPIEYGKFEGIIPKGEYGGGTVMLWDRGTWAPDEDEDAVSAWKKGRLKFTLEGEKLKGRWMLVRIASQDYNDGRNWLLIKERDDATQKADKYSVVDKLDRSVATGRDLDQIASGAASKRKGAKGGLTVWHSNKAESGDSSTGGKKTKAGKSKAGSRPAKGTKATLAGAAVRKIAGAKKSVMPDLIKPQLATLVKAAPEDDSWVHEIKFDGYRALTYLDKRSVRMLTRNGNDWTAKFGPIARACARLGIRQAILDGEIVIPGADEATSFQALQNSLSTGRQDELLYYVFDILHLDGYDLRDAALLDRKALLSDIIEAAPDGVHEHIRYSDHFEEPGPTVLRSACDMKLEGIISKKRTGRYTSARTESWVKSKCNQRQEFVVGGFTDPEGSRSHFGALLIGIPAASKGAKGKSADLKLKYAGRVGTGFSQKSLQELWKRLKPIEQDASPFSNAPKGARTRNVHWVKPVLVAEVEFSEFTSEGQLRHPSFQGLREDKMPGEIVKEVPKKPPTKTRKTTAGSAKKKTAARKKPAKDTIEIQGIAISNPDRVLYPEQGITKLDLVRYYEAVAPYMMPLIQHRPITLVRCPSGHGKPCFYQRHNRDQLPDGLEPVPVRDDDEKKIYMAIADKVGLVSLAQIGTLEIHGWGSRLPDLEHPDQIVLDIDPDPEAGWPATVKAARRLKELMKNLGFVPFLKTTGGKGLHVVAPLKPEADWGDVRQFAEAVAVAMVQQYPDEYVATMSKAKRKGKVYIDYLRNLRESSAIAPYSSRAREGAPISLPIAWSELEAKLDPQKFTVKSVPQRLKKRKANPWASFEKSRKPLRLERLLKRLTSG